MMLQSQGLLLTPLSTAVLLQTWHTTPGAPAFPSALADAIEYRLVVGQPGSNEEAVQAVRHLRRTGELLSSIRHICDRGRLDADGRYQPAARLPLQDSTAATPEEQVQPQEAGLGQQTGTRKGPEWSPLVRSPPAEGMKWAYGASQLGWHPAKHAEVRHEG
jgi:hypothetical protein